MTELLINETTRLEFDNFLTRPSHALLLIGSAGSGRSTVAKMLALELLKFDKLMESASFRLIEPDDNGKILIDQIRQLNSFLQLKHATNWRVVIIDKADKMLLPAQNSLLKLLEEPPRNTTIILTSEPNRLTPTIVSRTQRIDVRPVSLDLAKNFFAETGVNNIVQAYKMSGGRAGFMSQLILEADEHEFNQAVTEARKFLAASQVDRLVFINSLSKDRANSIAFVSVLSKVANSAIVNASTDESLRRWHRIMKSAYVADSALVANGNVKLALTDLVLNL